MDMYPHTVTLYHHDIVNDEDVYTRKVLSGVYLRESSGSIKSGNGFEKTPETVVSCDLKLSRTYKNTWHCVPGDKLVFGNKGDIKSFKELEDAVTVKSVTVNLCGSELDGVILRCE